MKKNDEKKMISLMGKAISWLKKDNEPVWSAIIDNEQCTLTMNDFPDEPLYTFRWKDCSIDFDDAPSCWNIPHE